MNMKRSLEKATAASRKGYIDDHDEIDSIFTKLLAIPIEKLGGIDIRDTGSQIDFLLNCWYITSDENVRSELTTGEFLALIKGLNDEPILETPEEEELSQQCYYSLLSCLEDHLRLASNNTAQLFLCCGINDFLRYAAEKAGRSRIGITNFYRIFKRDVYNTMGFTITDSTTLREYAEKLLEFQCRRWIPNRPVSEFEREIRESYDEFAYLILESSKLAFPDMFDIKAITAKYGSKERNDG